MDKKYKVKIDLEKPLDWDGDKDVFARTLADNTVLHIGNVVSTMSKLCQMATYNATNHDHTKIKYIMNSDDVVPHPHFLEYALNKFEGSWFKSGHVVIEKHHYFDNVHDDINLFDIIEGLVDGVCAGRGRGNQEPYSREVDSETLQLAFKNTFELIKEMTKFEEEEEVSLRTKYVTFDPLYDSLSDEDIQTTHDENIDTLLSIFADILEATFAKYEENKKDAELYLTFVSIFVTVMDLERKGTAAVFIENHLKDKAKELPIAVSDMIRQMASKDNMLYETFRVTVLTLAVPIMNTCEKIIKDSPESIVSPRDKLLATISTVGYGKYDSSNLKETFNELHTLATELYKNQNDLGILKRFQELITNGGK